MGEISSIIHKFEDGSFLAYDRGSFDSFRVSFYKPGGTYDTSPKDTDFFYFFLSIGNNQLVWEEILTLSKSVSRKTDFEKIIIPSITSSIKESKMFYALAAAMGAEENKAGTRLGKRVKLLGCYQVLILNMKPEIAANWSRKMPGKTMDWKIIDQECKKFGF
jgi:hypothetical protein